MKCDTGLKWVKQVKITQTREKIVRLNKAKFVFYIAMLHFQL